jgi:hypothetical protein
MGDGDAARRQEEISLTMDLCAVPLYLIRLLMSLSSCTGSSGVRKLLWGLLEVRMHGGRGLCVLSPAILSWKAGRDATCAQPSSAT